MAAQPEQSEQDYQQRGNERIGRSIKSGMWLPEEDQRLREAVARHGCKWVLVAADVGSRTGDQCFKRWNDAVNPDLDHSPWSAEEDQWLQEIVKTRGRNWKSIAAVCEKNRPTLALKNRYSLLQRRLGVTKRRNTQGKASSRATSHDGSEDASIWGNNILSDYDGDGEDALDDKAIASAAGSTQKKSAEIFDPGLLNWDLNTTLGMESNLSDIPPALATDAPIDDNQERDLTSAFPWSDIGFGNDPGMWPSPLGVSQRDEKRLVSRYRSPSMPATKSGHITPAVDAKDDGEKVVVTAHCPKDKLSSLMEAMMAIVDTVAVGKTSDGPG